MEPDRRPDSTQLPARLIFENGTVFSGFIFANGADCIGEVVFNTSITGYEEVLSDPSYKGQLIVMTYPQIGNYGISLEDNESLHLHLSALIVKEYVDFPSNWRSKKTLKQYLEDHSVVGLEGIDTRALTRFLRQNGALRAMITTSDSPLETLITQIQSYPKMEGLNLVQDVSSHKPFIWNDNPDHTFDVAVIDCGVKYNILRHFDAIGCRCHVFPSTVSAQTILSGGFDGAFISNGPGDPEPVTSVITTIQSLLGKIPLFGICLGHQLMGLAFGAKTYKLKFGHHGINHPILNLKTDKVEITSQNHGFCVDPKTLPSDVEVTHINLNDQTCAGISHTQYPAFSVQYHPESAPGPSDSTYLFQQFYEAMVAFNQHKQGHASTTARPTSQAQHGH